MRNRRNNYGKDNASESGLSPQSALGMFLAGLTMLIVGLFIFSQKVLVYTSFFSSGIHIHGFRLNSGLVVIPLIAGVIWMFVSPKSIWGKLLTGVGLLIIIVSVIMSTSIHLVTMSLFYWILILVLIFGGAGLILRVLLAK